MPFLTANCHLIFYGGEPLLAFDLIERTVSWLKGQNQKHRKNPAFSITTNGSLLTDKILRFLDRHRFWVELSFDGLAQKTQNNQGCFDRNLANLRKLLRMPRIALETNSVFTPRTVARLHDSVEFLLDTGIKNINLSLSTTAPWNKEALASLKNQMGKLRKSLVSHYRATGTIPVLEFRKKDSQGFFFCAAGLDRLAVTPEGKIWGCDLFEDYLKGREDSPEYRKFCFGDLSSFKKNHKTVYPRLRKNYARLSMGNFLTPRKKCLLCLYLDQCVVCPVNACLSSGKFLGQIPAHLCRTQEIRIEEREKFWREIQADYDISF